MEEQYISFETAKLGRDVGFPQRNDSADMFSGFVCGRCWVHDIGGGKAIFGNSNAHAAYAAPTQSQLQRWLREEHGIIVLVDTDSIKGLKGERRYLFNVKVKTLTDDDYGNKTTYFCDRYDYGDDSGVDTYEQALEIGLQEGLKLV